MKFKRFIFLTSFLFSFCIIWGQNNTGRLNNAQPQIIQKNGNENLNQKSNEKKSDFDVEPKDQVIADDLIVQGSIAAGLDAVNGESFGFTTLLLKQNNVQILFWDTSLSAGFPSNDWTLFANDSVVGGQSYFAVQDATALTIPVKFMAGAPNNSLYVASTSGNIGLGTSNPSAEIHIKDSDTPCLRLEQDNTGGWTPQTWDLAGNESNFFIRDVSNSSKLPFRIKPGAPTNSIYIANSGFVGFGNQYPDNIISVSGSLNADSSVILASRLNLPDTINAGGLVLNGQTMTFYNGQSWILVDDYDSQNLVSATLIGTSLQVDIENGQSVIVDIHPLIADLELRVAALEDSLGLKDLAFLNTRLFQNYPNPFFEETTIPLYIPKEVMSANLVIYNIKGEKIESFIISNRGNINFKIKNIQNGSYFYSLEIDGRECDSKIMIKGE